ncbi:MAG: zinc ribbon domain-containing protein [Sulfurimicrobium sp.]|nr:zinc ribbon domain-containing protein [Sulfurimicrobium sp.]
MLKLLFLSVTIVAFIIFFIGANKVQKSRLLWGVIGALSFWIPVLILWPIAKNYFQHSYVSRDDMAGLFYSYIAIISAVGVFASTMVYKKILLKPVQLTVDQNACVFCSECGTRCPANAAFCNKCGCKLSGG